MPTYAIGDVQGCYQELIALLEKIEFNEKTDTLWFAGDLVNRGPESLKVLRFIKTLPNKIVILGNHDLHLLALFNKHPYLKHQMNDVLTAEDADEIQTWLRQQPLLHYDKKFNAALCHAGIYPLWDLATAQQHSDEVSKILASDDYPMFLKKMYGDEPTIWQDDLDKFTRLRFITNAFTRMRLVDKNAALDFKYKDELANAPDNLMPWYQHPDRKTKNIKIIFGHWAALNGQANTENIYAIDTGCVWGNALTALRLNDWRLFSVSCK